MKVALSLPLIVASLLAGSCTPQVVTYVDGLASKSVNGPTLEDPKWDRFNHLPMDYFPLYVMGDVNEDGQTDKDDLALLKGLSSGSSESSLSCLAAGDLDQDARITELDIARLTEWLAVESPVQGVPLDWQPTLPCTFKQPAIAAQLEAYPGTTVGIRLLQSTHSVETVSAKLDEPGFEIQATDDGTGYDISVPENAPVGKHARVALTFPGGKTYDFSVLLPKLGEDAGPPAPARPEGLPKEPIPFPSPSPSPLISPSPSPSPLIMPSPSPSIPISRPSAPPFACPQTNKGCDALTIDFVGTYWYLPDLGGIPEGFQKLGCGANSVYPRFMKTPHGYYKAGQFINANELPLARASAHNAAEWAKVTSAIQAHRAAVMSDRELAFEMVQGHGSRKINWPSGGDCGWVGPGFPTGNNLYRSNFVIGNFIAASHHVCYWHVAETSCKAGNTPHAVDNAENRASASCSFGSTVNHPVHAAYHGTTATGSSTSSEDIRIYVGGPRANDRVRRALQEEQNDVDNGKSVDYGRLFGRLRTHAGGNDSLYTDNGYNDCQTLPTHATVGY